MAKFVWDAEKKKAISETEYNAGLNKAKPKETEGKPKPAVKPKETEGKPKPAVKPKETEGAE